MRTDLKTAEKMTIAILLGIVLLVIAIIVLLRRKRKSAAIVSQTPPVAVTGSTGTVSNYFGGGSTDTTPTLTITGVGQTVTGITPNQTVNPPAKAINLLATPAGIYSGTAVLKNANGLTLHTELLNNLNLSSSGEGAYPAIYFNPANPVWSITVPGTYSMEVTFNINGTNCTATTPLIVTSADLGQSGGTGLVITGVGQTVTGITPNQTVNPPARAINLLVTPAGIYSGTAVLKNASGVTLHTEPLTNLNLSASGEGAYPAIYFNPANPVWGITAPGTYTMEVTFTINGTDYTATTPLIVTAGDLGQSGSNSEGTALPGEPVDPNADVEIIVDHQTITGRFRFTGGNGLYNVVVKHNGTPISTQNGLAYTDFVEVSLPAGAYIGETLEFQFSGTGASTVSYFIPQIVPYEFEPDYSSWLDNVLKIRLRKPFNSRRYVMTDYGDNLGKNPHYQANGSLATVNGVKNSTVLTSKPMPALRHIQVIKYLIDSSIGNINVDGWKLFYDSPEKDKYLAVLDFWIKTAANQTV